MRASTTCCPGVAEIDRDGRIRTGTTVDDAQAKVADRLYAPESRSKRMECARSFSTVWDSTLAVFGRGPMRLRRRGQVCRARACGLDTGATGHGRPQASLIPSQDPTLIIRTSNPTGRRLHLYRRRTPPTRSIFGLTASPFRSEDRHHAWCSSADRRRAFRRRSPTPFCTGEGLIVLTGESGSGKTTLCRYLLQSLSVPHLPIIHIGDDRCSSDLRRCPGRMLLGLPAGQDWPIA